MTVHFYDVGKALAVLVKLPDGRQILVDTGDSPSRGDCVPCRAWHDHVMSGLRRDVDEKRIELIWLTHQHTDHIGGALEILSEFRVSHLVDNGTEPNRAAVRKIHGRASEQGTVVSCVSPGRTSIPFAASDEVRLTAIVPSAWGVTCSADPNNCSIALRIDYCQSSVLFTGDAEHWEEAQLDVGPTPISLLQVGHHGSKDSTSGGFLRKVRPKYAVVSSAKPDEWESTSSCSPARSTVERLTETIGEPGEKTMTVFDGEVSCKAGSSSNWQAIPTSNQLWFTARDGDVVLVTEGDGRFRRIVER